MKTVFKIVVWFTVAVIGLFVWNVTPDFRPLITWLIVAVFGCYVLSIIVQMAVKQVVLGEQQEVLSRVELLDRKVTVLLKDALDHRRVR